RVLKPKGILAIWSYSFFTIEPKIDDVVAKELLEPIDPFWAAGNRHVINGYRDLPLPFDEILNPPPFTMHVEWTLTQLSAYLRTWSAVKRFVVEHGTDPVEGLESKLKAIWDPPEIARAAQMTLFLRASRKP
ncbi:MAG: SAM-dependent methyltransferase, partial [Chloroflexota bacterium]